MKISDILRDQPVTISMEVFPPKTDVKLESVRESPAFTLPLSAVLTEPAAGPAVIPSRSRRISWRKESLPWPI